MQDAAFCKLDLRGARLKVILKRAVVMFLGCCILCSCKKRTEIPALQEIRKANINSEVTLVPSVAPTKVLQDKKAIILPHKLREQLMNKEGSQVLLNADYSYPQIENLSGLETIDLMNKEIKDSAEQEFKKNFDDVKEFALDFYHDHVEQGRPSSLLPFVSEQTYEVKYNDNFLVSILVTTFNDFGGAHPNTTYSSYTYHLLTGEKLSAAYFLPDHKTEEEVKQYVAEVFNTAYNEDKERFYPDAPDILAQGKFNYGYYITEDDIVFYMNPYEIAPYVAGIQEVKVQRNKGVEE